MKITKLGHCCLLIETRGKIILTDPGKYTIESHSQQKDIDYVLYTHEHSDHYHLESLKSILKNNPKAIVYANSSVSELLSKEGVPYQKVKHGDKIKLGEIELVGIGEKHAVMHSSIEQSDNIGFFIDKRLWYPGDAFTNPKRTVEILALPVSGPWIKISEGVDYALLIKPKIVFPVHDYIRSDSAHRVPQQVLSDNNIEFVVLNEGTSREF